MLDFERVWHQVSSARVVDPGKREMLRRFTLSWTMRALLTAAALSVFLAPAMAQQRAATLLQQVGQVSVLSDGNAVSLFDGNPIKPNQIVVTGANSYAKFQVSDGSIFEVFENSRVTFYDRGGGWKDLLNVWIGHVKVYVQHMFGPNPTSVTSPTAVISVRGTIFDVVVEDDDGTTLVSVDEGAVEVRNTIMPGKQPILKPGETIRVFRNQPIAKLADHGGIIQKALRQAEQALRDLAISRPGGIGGGTPGTVPGTGNGPQADKGKNPGGAPSPTGTGTSTGGAPGAPPPPPPPPGGGGD